MRGKQGKKNVKRRAFYLNDLVFQSVNESESVKQSENESESEISFDALWECSVNCVRI
jgi:hypothetical protein